MSKVLVIGSVNKDICLELDKPVEIGETKYAKSYSLRIGGKGLNQAIAAAQSGAHTGFLGAVHNSDQTQIKALLSRYNIDIEQMLIDSTRETGIAVVSLIGGDNSIIIASGANALVDEALITQNQDYIGSFDYILMQNEVCPSALYKIIELKAKYDYKIILNPAPYTVHEGLDYSQIDLLTPNESEFRLMSESGIELGSEQLLITLGGNGVKYMNKQYLAQAVAVKDTTGAGDCFNGYLVGLLTQGYEMEQALEIAQLAAARAVQTLGAHEGILSIEALREYYNGI